MVVVGRGRVVVDARCGFVVVVAGAVVLVDVLVLVDVAVLVLVDVDVLVLVDVVLVDVGVLGVPKLHVLACEVSTVIETMSFVFWRALTHGSGSASGAPVHGGTGLPSRKMITLSGASIVKVTESGVVFDASGAVMCAEKPSRS